MTNIDGDIDSTYETADYRIGDYMSHKHKYNYWS